MQLLKGAGREGAFQHSETWEKQVTEERKCVCANKVMKEHLCKRHKANCYLWSALWVGWTTIPVCPFLGDKTFGFKNWESLRQVGTGRSPYLCAVMGLEVGGRGVRGAELWCPALFLKLPLQTPGSPGSCTHRFECNCPVSRHGLDAGDLTQGNSQLGPSVAPSAKTGSVIITISAEIRGLNKWIHLECFFVHSRYSKMLGVIPYLLYLNLYWVIFTNSVI